VKHYLTAHDIANTVRMTRTLHKGAFLIVEGDTDARVYKRFVDEIKCKVIPAHHKDNATEVLKILENESLEGILVIVDADFWHLESIKTNSVNLFLTDTHDLETMIISNTEVLEKVLSEFGSTNKINQLHHPVIHLVLEATLPIGLLRWIASPSKDNLPLKFRDLLFENFVDKPKLKININKLLEEVKANSGDPEINEESIKNKIKSLKKENHDPWQVCSGHDMVQILAIGFRFVFGNKKTKKLTAEILEGMLRLVYEYSHFQLTQLCRSIKSWEKTNAGYKVLKQ
jgi:hypothetical protein